MPRFKYNMQQILNLKQKEEEQKKLEFSNAIKNLQAEQEKLDLVQYKIDYYKLEIKKQLTEEIKVSEIKASHIILKQCEDILCKQIEKVQLADKAVEMARIQMNESFIERKTFEKLKEKAFESFLKEEAIKEQKQLDEISSRLYHPII